MVNNNFIDVCLMPPNCVVSSQKSVHTFTNYFSAILFQKYRTKCMQILQNSVQKSVNITRTKMH